MGISFDKTNGIFHLQTENSSYIFYISNHRCLEHLYYGEKIEKDDIRYISNRQVYSFNAHEDRQSRAFSTATVGLEISPFNTGDFRTPSVIYDYENRVDCNKLRYVSHDIYDGRKQIVGMPSSRDNANCKTLEVLLLDDERAVEVTLFYTVYYGEDAICRYQTIKNVGGGRLNVTKFSSMSLDFYRSDFDLLTLEGNYLSERSQVLRTPIFKGVIKNCSLVGISSHYKNPFIALCSSNSTEDFGEVYGFNLVYSGNFCEEIEVDRLGNTRLVMGIDNSGFCWNLKNQETFYSPEAVMVFSNQGVGGLSRRFHDHIRNNIIEKQFAFSPRPIVINTWESAFFSVNEQMVIDFAKDSKKCGIDTVVLDDGWFRNNAKENLGDFYTDEQRFPSGIKALSEKVHEQGLNFGIWIEPEMVSPDSNLYREDANCALSTSKNPLISRNQYVLDLTNDKNVNKIANRIIQELKGAKIDYIKWDFNRYLNDASSNTCPSGEVYHRQTLGTYKLLELIKANFKGVLFETCSGGGGRFDLGMLYYSPQIWASDNTDPYERIFIQYGTSYAYPVSTLSCHFTEGVCTSGRPSTFDFRYNVACFGSYGYELDLTKYSDSDKQKFKEYSKRYREDEYLNLTGDLYRLISPKNNRLCAYMKVSKDKNSAQLTFLEMNASGLLESTTLRLKGLHPEKKYKNQNTGVILHGKTLMNVGIRLNDLFRDKRSNGYVVNFVAVD